MNAGGTKEREVRTWVLVCEVHKLVTPSPSRPLQYFRFQKGEQPRELPEKWKGTRTGSVDGRRAWTGAKVGSDSGGGVRAPPPPAHARTSHLRSSCRFTMTPDGAPSSGYSALWR